MAALIEALAIWRQLTPENQRVALEFVASLARPEKTKELPLSPKRQAET